MRDVLGEDVPGVTDKEIRETLWYYHFDVNKTINYILSSNIFSPSLPLPSFVGKLETNLILAQHGRTPKKKKKKPAQGSQKGISPPRVLNRYFEHTAHELARALPSGHASSYGGGFPKCARTATELGMFADCPWGRVPLHRRGCILVEKAYPNGGLLGGSGKVSKLAALAKARKEKAAAAAGRPPDGDEKTSVSLLSRLSMKSPPIRPPAPQPIPPEGPKPEASTVPTPTPPPPPPPASSQGFVQPGEAGNEPIHTPPTPTPPPPDPPTTPKANLLAPPSSFALSFFGPRFCSRIEIGKTDEKAFTISGAPPTPAVTKAFSEPSPDDIVVAAQSGSKGFLPSPSIGRLTSALTKYLGLNKKKAPPVPAPAQAQTPAEAGTGTDPTPSMQQLTLTPAAKRPRINVPEAFAKSKTKQSTNFIVIGHVDAGKSTLMGRLLYECGVISDRTIQKFKQEAERIGKSSFHYAWVLDQTAEERARGVTMDVATNKFETPKARFTILDAPGHRDFIPNMIAGAAQADFAVLVLDASTGAFEAGVQPRGQTKEHTLLVRAIGVSRLIVAVNKLDAVGWSHDRYKEIVQQTGHFLTLAGFAANKVSFVPLCGLTGENLTGKNGIPPAGKWYSGPTLLDLLESVPQAQLSNLISQPLRISVSDVPKATQTTIIGRVESGHVQPGDAVLAIPARESALVKSVLVDDEPAEWAVAGHNVTLQLSFDASHVRPGDVLCNPAGDLHRPPCLEFVVKLLAFEPLTPMPVDVLRGRLHAPASISKMLETLDKATAAVQKKKPRIVPAGTLARVVVTITQQGAAGGTAAGIPVESGNRVVLRAAGKTVAAGIVE